MDDRYIYGKLNQELEEKLVRYTGETTDTVEIVVDNENNTIKANYVGETPKEYTGGTTSTIEVSIDENNEITANYVGEEPRTYSGETTSSIEVIVDNETNKISANYVKAATRDFHPLKVGDTVKKIQFDLSLTTDNILDMFEELIGDLGELESGKSYFALQAQTNDGIQYLLEFYKGRVLDDVETIGYSYFVLLYNEEYHRHMDAIYAYIDTDPPSDPGYPYPMGFDVERETLNADGVLVLDKDTISLPSEVTILSLSEDEEKDDIWNGVLITGVSNNDDGGYLNVFNGNEELKTDIGLNTVLLTTPQNLTHDQQQTVLTNLGIINAIDLEY